MSELNVHIWYLVFLALDTIEDLKTVCLVSKSFNALATPILYRSIVLRNPTPSKEWRRGKGEFTLRHQCTLLAADETLFPFRVVRRLLDDSNVQLRRYVRDVVVENSSHSSMFGSFRRYGDPHHVVARLVEVLPNLENLFLHEAFESLDLLQDVFSRHKNKPSLHLLNENGMTPLTRTMPCVRSLGTSFRVYATSRMPGPLPSLDLPRCFKAFPNLTSLSIQTNGERIGPVQGGHWHLSARIEPLQLAENETFPPLEKLSLSGYLPTEAEWRHWKEKMTWSKLKSLSLGPIQTDDFLGPITGLVQSLSSFSISVHSGLQTDSHPDLDRFLMSFDTLEYLSVKGYSLPIDVVAHHTNLQSLTLHTLENRERERPILNPENIEYLDQQCRKIRYLEIDICLHDEWPDKVMDALATGFNNLRQLRLHVGLDIHRRTKAKSRAKLEPKLNYFSAHEFGHAFFRQRAPSKKLEFATLRAGETLRHYPGMAEPYIFEENRVSGMFRIWAPRMPCDGIEVRELDIEVDGP